MACGVGIVGCGYVADYYAVTLRAYASPPDGPSLRLLGAFDVRPERTAAFAACHGVIGFTCLDELLNDPAIQIIVVLTPPDQHTAVALRALSAGKHIYLEKPVGLALEEVDAVHAAAAASDLKVSAAPCCILGGTAQTLRRALHDGRIGAVRLAYAEVDDGPHHLMPTRSWVSASGAPWPRNHERQLGCLLEHGPYAVAWLAMLFGPVRQVTADAATLVADTRPAGPDFGCATLRFDGGVIARLTCGLIAPRNRGLSLFGQGGTLSVRNCAVDETAVVLRRYRRIRRRLILDPWGRRIPPLRPPVRAPRYRGSQYRNFAAGIAELAEAIDQGTTPRLGPAFHRHVTEVVLALHGAATDAVGQQKIASSFSPGDFPPMPWAD